MKDNAGFPIATVIGGGQLARMMQPAAIELGVNLRLLSVSIDESAARVIPDTHIGHHTDADAVRSAADGASVVTFDHEHVPNELLAQLQTGDIAVHPGPHALLYAQDKLAMRRKLTDIGVPCPRWREVTDLDNAREVLTEFGGHAVFKTARGGYDGKGVAVVHHSDDLAKISDWFDGDGPEILAEELVDFTRELAALVARSPSGQAAAWPIVQTVQTAGVCDEVIAPAPHLSEDTAARATQIALTIVKELDVTGVCAVELFETSDGAVVVNELAMRPHNSGHWTQDGALTSQFEQHLRAVLDLPLGDTTARAPWVVMVNVLGSSYPDLYRSYLHVMAHDPGVKIHMYGKEVRAGRKLGHVTVTGDDLDDVRSRARHAADFIMGRIDE